MSRGSLAVGIIGVLMGAFLVLVVILAIRDAGMQGLLPRRSPSHPRVSTDDVAAPNGSDPESSR